MVLRCSTALPATPVRQVAICAAAMWCMPERLRQICALRQVSECIDAQRMLSLPVTLRKGSCLGAGDVTYTLTADDLAAASRWALLGGPALRVRLRFFGVLACLVFGGDAATNHGRLSSRSIPLLVLVLLWICYRTYLLIYVTLASSRVFARLSVLHLPYTLKWDGSTLEWTSDRTRHAYGMQDLVRWAEQHERFFLQTNDNMLWIVGKSFFKTPADIDSLRNQLAVTSH
jgi:hypothetical protein